MLRQRVKEDLPGRWGQCLGFLCHPPITRPAVVDARAGHLRVAER